MKHRRWSKPKWFVYYNRLGTGFHSWTVIHEYGNECWVGYSSTLSAALAQAKYHERIRRYP